MKPIISPHAATLVESQCREPNGPRAAVRGRAGSCSCGSTNAHVPHEFRLTRLTLLICGLLVCTAGLQVVAQEPGLDTPPTSNSQVHDAGAPDAADAASPAEAAVEQPPRPAQASDGIQATVVPEAPEAPVAPGPPEAFVDAEPSDGTGVGSSTWTESPSQPAVNHELSVEPRTLPLLPDDAPAWVGSLPNLTDDVHRLFVGGQIAETESEAAQGLDTALVMAVRQYVEEDLLRSAGTGAALSEKLTADYVWKNLIDHQSGYVAKLNTAGQPMYQKWVTVSITPEQRAEIQRWHREVLQRERLAPIGLGVTSLLGCVGLMHLILRRKPGAVTRSVSKDG